MEIKEIHPWEDTILVHASSPQKSIVNSLGVGSKSNILHIAEFHPAIPVHCGIHGWVGSLLTAHVNRVQRKEKGITPRLQHVWDDRTLSFGRAGSEIGRICVKTAWVQVRIAEVVLHQRTVLLN